MKQDIEALLKQTLETLVTEGSLPTDCKAQTFLVERTKDERHGDFASNIALTLAKAAGSNPRAIAEKIIAALPSSSVIDKTQIAGPGFINFYLSKSSQTAIIDQVLQQGSAFGACQHGANKRIHMEFVSANPTGPLHVGHGRHAATGSAIASLLERVGYHVHKEYYVNDAGRQMDILATSVWLRYLSLFEQCQADIVFPSNGYRGQYIIDIAQTLKSQFSDKFVVDCKTLFANLPQDATADGQGDKEAHIDALVERAKEYLADNYTVVHAFGLNAILDDIKQDLAEFSVHYDNWFSEKSLFENNLIEQALSKLKTQGYTYEQDGALWFKATEFGDEKDRVLIRANGTPTYFASDCAYHVHKLDANEAILDVMGADHHGYVSRLKGLLTAQGISQEKLDVVLVQFASLYRGTEKVQMSTRSGEFVTLRELREEVGNDAARFFYINRKADQHLDFDLELAKSRSNENPVYYVQYAHARICSVFRQLEEKNLAHDIEQGKAAYDQLTSAHEQALLKTLSQYQELLISAAEHHEPHRVTQYLRSLAQDFHSYYNAEVFLLEENDLRNARMNLVKATQIVLANTLHLMGLSAPEKM